MREDDGAVHLDKEDRLREYAQMTQEERLQQLLLKIELGDERHELALEILEFNDFELVPRALEENTLAVVTNGQARVRHREAFGWVIRALEVIPDRVKPRLPDVTWIVKLSRDIGVITPVT